MSAKHLAAGGAVAGLVLLVAVALLVEDDPPPSPAPPAGASGGAPTEDRPRVTFSTEGAGPSGSTTTGEGQPDGADGGGSATDPAPAAAAEVPVAPPTEASGTLVGRIVDDQGVSLLSPEVALTPGNGGGERVFGAGELSPDASGRFELAVPAGSWVVVGRSKGHTDSPPVRVHVPQGGKAAVSLVVVRQGVLRGSVRLTPELAAKLPLTLRLVMEVSPDETPTVETMDEEPEVRIRRQEVWVGPNQTFELEGCDRGLYRMRLELLRPGGNVISAWSQTYLDPGDVREGIEIDFLDEPELALEGRVLDEAGAPVEGALVELGVHQVITASDGRFELRGLELGPHRLTVAREGYAGLMMNVEHTGEVVRGVELRIERR